MSDTFDHDAARDVLRGHYGRFTDAREGMALDALEACVRPAPQQTLDRGGVYLTSEEAGAAAWAFDHLAEVHGYDAIRSNSGTRVDVRLLADRLEAAS